MKKFILFMLVLILLTGCHKEEKVIDLSFDDDYYTIATPYKEGVGNNYIRPSVITTYDYSQVESDLMDLSTKYFATSKYRFQAGQYLTEKKLIGLLNDKNLNNTPEVKIDDITLKPNYISGIHEQNFLDKKNNLKGVSIALVLNPYQEYKNDNGSYLYKEIDKNVLVEYGQNKSKELLKELRKIKAYQNIDIMMAIYIIGDPNDNVDGHFEYIGKTNNDMIEYEKINYEYHYLTSNYVLEHDLNNYKAFDSLNNTMTKKLDNFYITAKGLYINNNLNKLDVEINSSLMNKDKMLMVSQMFADQIINSFDESLLIRVYFKIGNETKVLIVKKRNSIETNIYLLNN